MAVEYEVRDYYRDYSVSQLLTAPVSCFQGVGDIQSEILERYFGVTTVQELAQLPAFLQALSVQETAVADGDVAEATVEDVAAQRGLPFSVRSMDRSRRMSELPEAPVHVLEGITPAQDLALYDAFRITNVSHLASNRIMLEARVIDYLAHQAEAGGEGGADSTTALASILGARQAGIDRQAARAGSETDDTARATAEEVSSHVRERLEAMRDRVQDRSAERAEEGSRGDQIAGAHGAPSRMDMIRQSRERHAPGGRRTELAQVRTGGATATATEDRPARSGSRVDDVLASRSVAGRETREAVSARVAGRGAVPTGSERAGAASDRVSAVLAAREAGGAGAAAGGGTASTTTTRTTTTPSRASTSGQARRGAAAPAEGEMAAAAGGGVEAPSAPERSAAPPRRAGPPPGVWVAAALVVLLLLAGLLAFWLLRSEEPQMAEQPPVEQGMAESGEQGMAGGSEQGMAGTAEQGTAGEPGATGEQAGATEDMGTTGQAEGQQAVAGQQAAASTESQDTGGGIKSVYTVVRGDSLWKISGREYQDPWQWPSIYLENNDQIDNPDLIHPRQEFRIPARPQYRYPEYPAGYEPSRP